MCDMKSEGGLTRGRGMSDSVLAKWVEGAHTATAICSSLEVFADVHFMSGKQHVDFRVSGAEHLLTSVDVNFDGNMLATVQQENFLANEKNKTKLSELLVETLTSRGIEASTATGDTYGSTVRSGLNKVTSHLSVVVIGEDVDLLILLTALVPPDRNVHFMKPLTSSTNPPSTPDAVAQAGEEMFLTMYQTPPSECDLNNHPYNSFVKSSTKVIANLASLPPTKGAAKQHTYRHNNDLTMTLNPERCGWVWDNCGVLNPVKTTDPVAPNSTLNSIFCSCATGCGGCDGACMNSASIRVEEDEDFMDFEYMTTLKIF
ncbi:hypothetical protein PR048_019576 [Dryococelus australis]|uniref:Uncharacterized protein n=1 Tax=Dryococelus australis TaxID=614101 RepID=A0ABQ9H3U9_9NEOP|nr:hypothetical protein PR048_019576 [Dryococelus australis]